VALVSSADRAFKFELNKGPTVRASAGCSRPRLHLTGTPVSGSNRVPTAKLAPWLELTCRTGNNRRGFSAFAAAEGISRRAKKRRRQLEVVVAIGRRAAVPPPSLSDRTEIRRATSARLARENLPNAKSAFARDKRDGSVESPVRDSTV